MKYNELKEAFKFKGPTFENKFEKAKKLINDNPEEEFEALVINNRMVLVGILSIDQDNTCFVRTWRETINVMGHQEKQGIFFEKDEIIDIIFENDAPTFKLKDFK